MVKGGGSSNVDKRAGEGLKIPISNPIFQFATKPESLLVRFWKVLDLASL